MGACASVPKAMRGEVTVEPPPEQLKEETLVLANTAEAEETKVEEEKTMVVVENDKSQSLKTFLVEEEVPKEPEGSSKATTVPENEIEEEEEKESRPEPVPVPKPVAASESEEKSTKATA